MASNSRNTKIAVGVAIVLALVVVLLRRPASPPPVNGQGLIEGSAPADAPAGDAPGARPASARRAEKPLGKDPAVADAETAEYLREQFGATIDNKHTQIKAIEKLIEYLIKNYPADWKQRIQALLAQAFPGLADQLYAEFQNMTAYNEWLKANREALAEMTPGEKRDALSDARFRYFGPDAAEIFEESLRHERIYDAMDSINQSTDTTVDQKLSTFIDAINQTYGDQAPAFIERRQTELMNNFLTLDTVQSDLHALSPEAREQQLDQIRGKMGMDEAARDRWRELDGQRDKAWEEGDKYMEQREQIARSFQGDEQARRLNALRSQMFGPEADVIGEEENSGFFRFGHRRVYGKE